MREFAGVDRERERERERKRVSQSTTRRRNWLTGRERLRRIETSTATRLGYF